LVNSHEVWVACYAFQPGVFHSCDGSRRSEVLAPGLLFFSQVFFSNPCIQERYGGGFFSLSPASGLDRRIGPPHRTYFPRGPLRWSCEEMLSTTLGNGYVSSFVSPFDCCGFVSLSVCPSPPPLRRAVSSDTKHFSLLEPSPRSFFCSKVVLRFPGAPKRHALLRRTAVSEQPPPLLPTLSIFSSPCSEPTCPGCPFPQL